EHAGAIQLRSDVERKRMHGLAATYRGGASPDAALYDPDSTRQVYDHLLGLARQAVEAGWPVIVDAAFLKAGQRHPFEKLASALGIPFIIFDMQAGEATM